MSNYKKKYSIYFFIFLLLFLNSSGLLAEDKQAPDKEKKIEIFTVEVIRGAVENAEGKIYTNGQKFTVVVDAQLMLEPRTVLKTTAKKDESLIIRNHNSYKTNTCIEKNLKKQIVSAYAKIKNLLYSKNFYYVCRPEGEINIDGKLDDLAWKKAVPMPLFSDLVTGQGTRYAATCKALWDDHYLYLGYRVEDPQIWTFATTRDEQFYVGAVNGSFVKFFADVDCDTRNYVEIHVNPVNNLMDAWLPYTYSIKNFREETGIDNLEPSFLAFEWDCEGIKTAVHIEGTLNDPTDVDEYWTAEWAIPFAALKRFDLSGQNCPPRDNTKWLVHLCRRYRLMNDAPTNDIWYYAWPPCGEVSTHRLSKYGYFIFKNTTWRELMKEAYAEKIEDIKMGIAK
ncbi:MAG: hypothetical protein A2096_13700 [Spirochaetes bacterium GWF1_41_5]|nr:MAG: hypothetical protein A2096_13700 [Spirochaetes bacterium GWF1_41_5]HBE00935.1 hypothetical protein [Spirochaetia bacterium]